MTKKTTKRLYHQDGRRYLLEGEGGTAIPGKEITTLTYNDDGYVIQVIYTYTGTADTFEERFEYTDNQVTKKESKDTIASTWVQTTYVWTDNELGVPSYADILDWTILIP